MRTEALAITKAALAAVRKVVAGMVVFAIK
jgi:hypothetical protein